ncbi:MAG: hypothetical protein WC881_07090, partial [Elusimicrobiota bacterium]
MKRVFIALAVLAVGIFAAAEPANISRTRLPDKYEDVFVGHYGEILRLDRDWTADAEMNGPMEVIRFHERTVDSRKLSAPEYHPQAEDYVPENFAAKRLMQLLVIPKAARGFKSLSALKAAKLQELDKS